MLARQQLMAKINGYGTGFYQLVDFITIIN